MKEHFTKRKFAKRNRYPPPLNPNFTTLARINQNSTMNLQIINTGLVLLLAFCLSCQQTSQKMLVFSKTAGFRHESIEPGIEALKKLGTSNGFEVIATEDASYFEEETLKDFTVVVFLNTTGDVLNFNQQADFERYIQAGGGFVGIHAATDTEYGWHWYGGLVGGYFDSHPKVQEAKLIVEDRSHISTKHLEEEWIREDEWYNFKKLNPDVHVLVSIDENSYEGGNHGGSHPMAWYHEYDGGRAFYTEFGHTPETYQEEAYLKHLLGGIKYAAGNNQRDYAKAKSDRIPLENRFVRTILAQNLHEPMELDVLDKDHLIFIERHGGIKIYDLKEDKLEKIAHLPVFSKLEDGLLGIAVDPNYEENNWIYLFYSPPGREAKQHLSRFVLKDNQLDMDSEIVVMEVKTQRDECCHSGGSVEFGPDGLLYISTGDDTNPFASNGFAPIDERPGRTPWDAQRTSGNTNDLRGKILRIKPEDDGTYSIPEGNLFPPGTEKARPEIYVMGCRNPFRISVDYKTNFLYWGDVGPDAGKDSETRGPKGHDELNQARHAGFWGWPYTRGNNKAYFDYDFAAQKSGEQFNAEKLLNDSPNNTGLNELPPAQKSFIWYSYDDSEEFPWTGTGGKNPMAGPIYYSDMFEGLENRFPDYFNGKIIFYEWMRDWMFVVTMDENHNFVKAEPFMPNTDFANPMDMVFGKDGNLYILEYGESWNTQNLDARLNKIEYIKGNRTPIARIESDVYVGAAPLTVNFTANASEDFDGDKLAYEWSFTGEGVQSKEAEPSFTFEASGIYKVSLKATDPSGRSHTTTQEMLVGNAPPKVSIELGTDNMYYWDNRAVPYQVKVTDKEDGSVTDGGIDPSKVRVTLTYIPEGEDLISASLGHQQSTGPEGKVLIDGSDCKACHAVDKQINGPSYQDIATKYEEKDKGYLVQKIINGGSGVWGEMMMSAHPQLAEGDVEIMVDYILKLDEALEAEVKTLPVSGALSLVDHIGKEVGGKYVMMASYEDAGNDPIGSLNDQHMIELEYPKLEAEENDGMTEGIPVHGGLVLGLLKHNNYFMFKEVDFTDLKSVILNVVFYQRQAYKGGVEVRLGSVDGELLGVDRWTNETPKRAIKQFRIPIQPTTGKHDIYFVFKNEADPTQRIANVDGVVLGYESPEM